MNTPTRLAPLLFLAAVAIHAPLAHAQTIVRGNALGSPLVTTPFGTTYGYGLNQTSNTALSTGSNVGAFLSGKETLDQAANNSAAGLPAQTLSPEDQAKAQQDANAKAVQAQAKTAADMAARRQAAGTRAGLGIPAALINGTVRGHGVASSGSGLTIAGHFISLAGLSAPAPAAECFTKAVPWSCGDDAQAQLQSILDRADVTCRVTGTSGSCTTPGGDDVAHLMALSGLGYGGGTLQSDTNIARADRRGVWASDGADQGEGQ